MRIKFTLLVCIIFTLLITSTAFAASQLIVSDVNVDSVFYYGDGRKYVGEWKNNNRNGHGIFTWADRSTYVGEWKNGNITGRGAFTDINGKCISGVWESGKLIEGPENSNNTPIVLNTWSIVPNTQPNLTTN